MTTVKILHGVVGEYNEGDVVKDAPPGLVEIAEKGTVNLATGQRVAEIVGEKATPPAPEVDATLLTRAIELKIEKADKMDNDQLKAAIESAEAEAELKELKAAAKEYKIEGYGKMTAEQLKVAIATLGKDKVDAAELKKLHAKAAELEIADAETLDFDELVVAIAAAEKAKAGGNGAE